MRVYMFSDYLKMIHGDPLNESQIICEIDSISDFPDGLVSVKGKVASVCHINQKEDFITIRFVEGILNDDEASYKDSITCPHCGTEVSDSYEYDDSDDNYECETCESVFSYERHIDVTYSSTMVERNNLVHRLDKEPNQT